MNHLLEIDVDVQIACKLTKKNGLETKNSSYHTRTRKKVTASQGDKKRKKEVKQDEKHPKD
jgi:hypothetical protein